MSATRLAPIVALAAALLLPGAAVADTVETNAPSTLCNETVYVSEGSFRHGDHEVTTPEQTIRLSDRSDALGAQDPCAAFAVPVETTAPSALCNASVYVGGASFRHGDLTVTAPEQTVRLSDHSGALGEQDPCVG